MATRNRRLDRALAQSRDIKAEFGRELRLGRGRAGLSQDAAGEAVGMSGSQYGRLERGEVRGLTLEQLCRAAAAVGLAPTVRFYPDGDPVRDIAHVRLLDRLRKELPGSVAWSSEVPVRGSFDLRCWDAVLGYEGSKRDAIEAETRILDAQATWRRASRKLHDDPSVEHLILLVADTVRNRRAIAATRELLRPDLPLDSRAVLAALRRGESPGANGVLFL